MITRAQTTPAIKVEVPQSSGQIVVSHARPDPVTFEVSDGVVSCATQADADLLLSVIEGSSAQ